FDSKWCRIEFESFYRRSQMVNIATGLILPVKLAHGEQFPEFAKRIQWFDFEKFFFTAPKFRSSPQFFDFEVEVRRLAQDAFQMIEAAPPFDSTWHTVSDPELTLASKASQIPFAVRPNANDFRPFQPLEKDQAVFCEDGSELIPEAPFDWKSQVVKIADEGRAYLRLYPLKSQTSLKTALEAQTLTSNGGLRPMGTDLSEWTPGRNAFGAIVYESPVDQKLYHLTQLFLSRELWGIDAYAVNATH